MTTPEVPCAASWLLAPLLDGPPTGLVEVTRSRVSVHYETGDPAVPVLTVCTEAAVRLPNSLVSGILPGPGPAYVGAGSFRVGGRTWRVRRWWRPPRLSGLSRPTAAAVASTAAQVEVPVGVPAVRPAYDGLRPAQLVGKGPGLTPAGDDVLAGALVTAHATADPRLASWRRSTRAALHRSPTTAVSRALLHHAVDGYAAPQLAAFVTALCRGEDLTRPTFDLHGVGHTSGAALIHGVLHTVSTHHLEGAA